MALIIDNTVVSRPASRTTTTPVDPSDRKLHLMGAGTSEGKKALDRFDAALTTQQSRNAAAGGWPEAVRTTQSRLNSLGYDTGGVDGIAGSRTDAAIRAFQAANGLDVDGIVGPKTRAALAAAQSGRDATSGVTPASSNNNFAYLDRLPEEDRLAAREGMTASLKAKADRLEGSLDALGPDGGAIAGELESELARTNAQLSKLNGPQPAAAERTTPAGQRPPLPAAVAAEENGQQHAVSGFDGDEASARVWPAGGGYYLHEYLWDEGSQTWVDSAYQWGSPGGATLGRHDFIDPENDFRNPQPRADNRSAYEIMRDDHWDREGNKQNSYPNTLTPGSFNGPIEPTYENYPVEPDPVVGAVASFLGFPFFSPFNPEGHSDPVAGAAGTFDTIVSPSPTAPLTILAGESLGAANEHRGRPTLEGGIDPSRAHRGVPHPR